MFSFDLSHPKYPYAVIGAKCLTCYTDVWYYTKAKEQYQWYQEQFVNPTARLCKCKSIGCAVDDDGTFNLYADDIRKVHLGHFIFNKTGELLSTEWWNVSGSFIYVDYHRVKQEAIRYKPKEDLPKIKKVKPKVSGFDDELVKALDTHSDYQSRMFYYTNNWKVL